MAEISPDEFCERHRAPDDEFVVLDIRPEAEFEEWHIPGSRNIDVYDELQAGSERAKASLRTLPEDKEIITVCAAGERSRTATTLLEDLGYDATTLADGLNGWSRVHRQAPIEVDIDGSLIQVARPGKGCLSHVLVSDGEAAVFDPSHYTDEYEAVITGHDATLVGVVDTHAHADHVSGGRQLAADYDVPYYLHPADAEALEATPLRDGLTLSIGRVPVRVVHTPGHSPGSVTLDVGGEAFLTGDTLFHDSVGRVELGVEAGLEDTDVETNAATLYESLQRLLEAAAGRLVLPAHDPGSPEPPVAARLAAVQDRNDDLDRDREAFIETLAADRPEHPPNFQRIKRVNTGIEQVDRADLAELESGPNRCAAD